MSAAARWPRALVDNSLLSTMPVGYKHLTPLEIRLAKQWHSEGDSVTKIASKLSRDPSTISRHVFKKNVVKKPKGRPITITDAKLEKLKSAMAALQAKAGGKNEVTLAMIMKRARVTASERTVRDALHSAGVFFYKMYSKPVMSDGDS